MCGIIGYTGLKNSIDVLFEGLSALEYRGYDSAGIAFFENGLMKVIKCAGKLQNLKDKVAGKNYVSDCGIGHTRWATHGKPDDVNAHPHATNNLAVVHNGIIENYVEIKAMLEEKNVSFVSETDTECALKLIDSLYSENHDPFEAIVRATEYIRGSYAFALVFADIPGKIYAVRKGSPLICATDCTGNYVASDVTAILSHTDKYYPLEEGEIAVLSGQEIRFYDFGKNEITKERLYADWEASSANIGSFSHFMMKEISEEPFVIRKNAEKRIRNGLPELGVSGLTDEIILNTKRIVIVACGTAMHAGMIGKYVFEKLCRIPVTVEIASEFRYSDPILSSDDLVIIISQSGETADSLAALRLAKERGVRVLSVVNVFGSTIARESDFVFYTNAGPEIAVASTKAYSVQVLSLILIALKFASVKKTVPKDKIKEFTDELIFDIPTFVKSVIEKSDEIKEIAKVICKNEDLFFIGRGTGYYLSLEGSLKLKEVSYIHSEAYAAGELKHGTISLISDGTPVIAVSTDDPTFEKTISNIKETLSRGAKVIFICKSKSKIPEEIADNVITVPETSDIFTPLVTIPVLQLLAYHTAVLRGCDVDKPRNLAKSVTVE